MYKTRFNLPLYKAVHKTGNKAKCAMIIVIIMMIVSATGNAQLKGYYWNFSDVSNTVFKSVPAVAGSTDTLQLDKMGTGSFGTATTDNVGLGTSCTGPILVRPFVKSIGLEFLNSPPRLVTNLYTIEMVINLTDDNIRRRLFGFYDLSGPTGNYGIYVTETGAIDFYNGTSHLLTASPLSVNTWYQLMFVRSAANIISYYRNGVLIGTYEDSLNQFIPHPEPDNYNIVTFLMDIAGDESDGKIARIGMYNDTLSLVAIQERFDNICNTGIPVVTPWNTKGNSGTTPSNFIGTKGNQPLIFKTKNVEAFRIDTSGQVSIATLLHPVGYKLAVGGAVIATKVRVSELINWPDYVFDKKYRLPSLKEIEAFINKNKHLPGIPSTKEVEEKGIDLGDQQVLLLKKIEEMTLHLININKQVERLTQENEVLKKKLDKALR